MARKKTGQLICRKGWYFARVTTVIDGEKVRVMKPLATQNLVVARRKLERLNACESPKAEDTKRPETFAEVAERVYAARISEVESDPLRARSPQQELAQLRQYSFPIIGHISSLTVSPADVNSVLDQAKASGLSQQTVQHLKQRMSNVFAAFKREPGGRRDNPVEDAAMPKFADKIVKERAVLTDRELAIYLAWEHPEKRYHPAVLERQTMACVARMFGGLRTSDLHALRWETFDVEHGAFASGWAPRQKTRRPQLLEVPEMLRPILRAWWQQAGRPQAGVVFPVRRAGRRGNRVGEGRHKASHAKAFRRDLQRAFAAFSEAPAKGTQRWRELFEELEYTLPIDFHSWRRAYAQALADADVNAQQAAALAGHADLGAHARYLRNAGKMRTLPQGALPRLEFRQRAQAKGSEGLGAVSERLTEQEARSATRANSTGWNPPQINPLPWEAGTLPTELCPRGADNDQKAPTAPEQKAHPLPNTNKPTAIPAHPAVRPLDLLAAIDAAALAGDLHAVRALVAEAARIERDRLAASAADDAESGR